MTGRGRNLGAAESVEQVRRRFEDWRRSPGRGRRIPEELWDSAVHLAEEHGVHRTRLALGLNGQALKERVALGGPGQSGIAPTSPAFVEIEAPSLPLGASVECVLELEDRAGAKLRLQLRSAAAPDLGALTRAFLRGEG
jgi:hypothetical protein